ncbi:lambda-crystallin-like [Leptonychotes weddellii]|nr:lambda-crystallin-like [Leptonychotes weddellii]
MSDGLGMRYAFIGPLETMHLNAEGMLSYCDKYSEGMQRVLKTFGPIPDFSGATVEKVNQAMCVKVPDDPEHLAARRQWRDECLLRLAKLKRQMQSQ